MSCETCGAAKDAANRIKKDKRTHELQKLTIICVSILLGVAMVCGTVLGCYSAKKQQETIIEQQYAISAQYAQLANLLSGAEITTSEYTAEADGDGSISVAGDGNTTVGGDVVNGE